MAFKKQNSGQSVSKSWFWMHTFDWPEQTLKIYMQYSMYFACHNDLCRAVLTNILGDIFLSFLPHLSLEEGIWEEWQVPKVAENLTFRCWHLIGWNKQTKFGAIFSLREWLVQRYAARLFGNDFLNFVSNFSLEVGNWVVYLWHQHISKMGYFKCTILFIMCNISFLSYYDIGCTMFREHIYCFADLCTCKNWCNKPIFWILFP